MKLAVAVQRYGADINGGAELHARYIAERLARHAEVEVVTTCARNYVTWRNERPPGVETVNGVPVRRFPVDRERDPADFGRRSARVFEQRHSIEDELAWLKSEGPTSRALVDYLTNQAFDFVILFSYRYYHAYHAARRLPAKAVLVPTAERDPAVALGIFGPVFRSVRAIMPVPQHPRIHHLGFLADQDKFDAMAAADLLIMPSYFESLSMVALEAWALGRPVLANGRCDVLKGQCIRSNAGLYYELSLIHI